MKPDGAPEVPDEHGRLRLHRALASGVCTWRDVRRLVLANASALNHYDTEGNLPIHIGVMHRHDGAVRYMLNVKPELAVMSDRHGRTASDCRAERGDSYDLLDVGYEIRACCGCL